VEHDAAMIPQGQLLGQRGGRYGNIRIRNDLGSCKAAEPTRTYGALMVTLLLAELLPAALLTVSLTV
jgi:hypothetical protein